MRTNKTLTIVAALLAGTALASAQQQPRQERPNWKQAGFNCPVCSSPCVSKVALQQQVRQRRIQKQCEPRFRGNIQPGPPSRPRQGNRVNASRQTGQWSRQQGFGRFDFDGDGQLSPAERAAQRSYCDALDRKQETQPNERPARRAPLAE